MKDGLQEYQSRINRVMNYVIQNLAGDLSLENLSKVACFSPYHFHRIFRAATSETLGDYIRRQRLEAAASALTHRKADTLTVLALDVGFGSLAAFTRAFKDHFGLSPSEWRKKPVTAYHSKHGRQENVLKATDSKLDQSASKAGKADFSPQEYPIEKEQGRKLMQPKIEQAQDQKVVYWRAIGEYGPQGEIGQVWQNVYQWAGARGLFEGQDWTLYGVSWDDPYIAPKDKCRYDACVAVKEDLDTGDQSTQVIPGSKIAVFLFDGTQSEMGSFYDRIFKEWLPQSGFVPGDSPCYERYLPSHPMDMESGRIVCDICVPVQPA